MLLCLAAGQRRCPVCGGTRSRCTHTHAHTHTRDTHGHTHTHGDTQEHKTRADMSTHTLLFPSSPLPILLPSLVPSGHAGSVSGVPLGPPADCPHSWDQRGWQHHRGRLPGFLGVSGRRQGEEVGEWKWKVWEGCVREISSCVQAA